ncbi:DUF4625 domain-containing protein [Negadavirga shengliensis]|uniref:DUF4625 domain-containing protein n=1 Tax=Negadavirga shengliensis TaxID=1389218 RepID=A0ABV9T025_9BACT
MKKTLLSCIFISAFLLYSCETDDDPIRDLDAPVIGNADGREEIRPGNGEIREAGTDHMHVRFGVDDATGIEQIRVSIHANFDGHSHARVKSDFEKLNVSDIYSPNASNPDFRFPAGATRVNVDATGTDIYWAGPNSRVESPVLAGPYDFVIEATDILGNQTSYADNSNYLATFYIRTPYAPVIDVTNLHDDELDGEAGAALEVQGTVGRGTHELSSDLAFLSVRLTEEHDDHNGNPNQRIMDEDFYEKMWGSSNWIDGAQGAELPDTKEINLAELLTGENAIILPEGEEHLELIIWAEDVNGNITEMVYEVHVD